MCGIAGIIDFADSRKNKKWYSAVQRMTESMAHRGPDYLGLWQSKDSCYTLGHARLSVIDLSEFARQPFSLDSRYVLVFNGEIYNYHELKHLLVSNFSAHFRSDSDTEVLYQGLILMGADFLTYVDGMFAFAFLDNENQELLLARDAFGEKPLYYTQQEGAIAFASELSAFEKDTDFELSIHKNDLFSYLSFHHVPAPRTIYSNVNKLPPGHFLRLSKNRLSSSCKYFQFHCTPEIGGTSERERLNTLQTLFEQSVERRLRSDVPLGVFLSAGVDSSLTSAAATKLSTKKLDSYSVGFENVEESEHREAAKISKLLGTKHHQIMVKPIDYILMLDELAKLDEPNSDASCVPTYLISKLARTGQTVCLTGDGGDELFGGYQRYYRVLERATQRQSQIQGRKWHIGREYISGTLLNFADRNLVELLGYLPNSCQDNFLHYRKMIDLRSDYIPNRLRETDIELYLPVVLAKVDRMSMRHSLECRTPFLNPELVQFAQTLRPDELHRNGQGKYLLKKLLERYLPQNYIQKVKRGFGIDPGFEALRNLTYAKLQEVIMSSNCQLSNFFDYELLRQYVHHQIPREGFFHAWSLLHLETWLQARSYKVLSD